jgi:K+ transporter
VGTKTVDRSAEKAKLLAAVEGLEGQRALLGDAVVDPAIAALREQLAALAPTRNMSAI